MKNILQFVKALIKMRIDVAGENKNTYLKLWR